MPQPTNLEVLESCKMSKEFFFENFYQIPDIVNNKLSMFDLRDYQKKILTAMSGEKRIIGLKARQIGWTTLAVANSLHDVLFSEWRPWLFVSRNERAAQDMVAKAKIAYYRLPAWMRQALPRLSGETKSGLIFDNGSRIESVPATADTGRGDAVYGTLMDECAFMEYGEEIWNAIEPLTYGVAMLFSTANGMGNFFHEVWLDSQREDSVWKGIFFPWDVVPSRDTAWYDLKKRSFRGREWGFYQEYPSSPEEAFARSGRVAFASDIVEPNFVPLEPQRYEWVIGSGAKELEPVREADIEIHVYREPEVERDEHQRPLWEPNYVVGVDVAEGLEHGDFSYVTVFDVNKREQVAKCKSSIPVSYLDELIMWFAEYYLTALVIVERNNPGILPLDRLYRDHWYPRLYRMDSFGEQHLSDRTPRFGWRTDKATKPKMVNDFIYALSEGDVILHDPDFRLESQTFVADGKGGYAATSSNHDDVIMGTLVAWQGVLDSFTYPILWRDTELLPPTHDEMDALFFADDKVYAADVLEAPIGQKKLDVGIKKTFFLLDENFRKGGM